MRRGPGHHLVQEPYQLAQYLNLLAGVAGDVSPRLGQTCDEPSADGVREARHDDGYRLCRPLRGAGSLPVSDQDHLDLLPEQFADQGLQTARVTIGIDDSILDVLPLQPAEFTHALLERRVEICDSGFRSERQPTDTTDRRSRLPMAGPKRDQQADAAGEQDTTARNHWITSSVRASNDCGIVSPSAFAVFELMTSSNLVGCSTGKSAGLAPLRILSTYPAPIT